MTVANQNFKVFRGDTHKVSVAVTQADGTPYDPSLNVKMRWRLTKSRFATDDEAMIRKVTGDGIALVTGGVEITLSAVDTDLKPGLYYHELKVWDDTDVAVAMTGNAVIKPTVRMGDRISLGAGSFALVGSAPTVG